ncbi:MAG TPA: hypothetical protein VGG74_11900 [Kofleriaceae bacterium]
MKFDVAWFAARFAGDVDARVHAFELDLYEREMHRLEMYAAWSEDERKLHARLQGALELLRARGPQHG